MILTHRLATVDDAAAIAAAWNARARVAASCWYQAPTVDAARVLVEMQRERVTFHVVEQEGTVVGFSYHRGATLFASCGPTPRVYYLALAAYAAHATLAGGDTRGECLVNARHTDEMQWLLALAVARFEPTGYAPLAPGQDEAQRVAMVTEYRVTADLEALHAAASRLAQEA